MRFALTEWMSFSWENIVVVTNPARKLLFQWMGYGLLMIANNHKTEYYLSVCSITKCLIISIIIKSCEQGTWPPARLRNNMSNGIMGRCSATPRLSYPQLKTMTGHSNGLLSVSNLMAMTTDEGMRVDVRDTCSSHPIKMSTVACRVEWIDEEP